MSDKDKEELERITKEFLELKGKVITERNKPISISKKQEEYERFQLTSDFLKRRHISDERFIRAKQAAMLLATALRPNYMPDYNSINVIPKSNNNHEI